MSNIANLPVTNGKPREHITIPIDEFSEKLGQLLADGEDKASRLTMLGLDTPADRIADLCETNEVTNPLRARLYAATLRTLLKGLAK